MRAALPLLISLGACAPPASLVAPPPEPAPPASASASSPSPSSTIPVQPPVEASPHAPPDPDEAIAAGTLIDLPVPGHPTAVVAAPRPGRRPVVVATHGAGGTPEALCAYFRELLDDRAFVLCPRGVTMDVYAPPQARTYFYSAHPALEREVRAALDALAARFPARVDLDRAAYAGFSQGATMGALAFSRSPAPFTTAVLIEGGVEEWSRYTAGLFKARGGRRVVFACGRRSCADAARRSAAILLRAGVESRVVDAPGAGHTYEGAVREGVSEALPWLVEGDPRFR